MALSEQEQIRREKLNELLQMGINPYPAAKFEVNSNSTFILENYEKAETRFGAGKEEVSIGGRIMSVRDMGKAAFAQIQDAEGKNSDIH